MPMAYFASFKRSFWILLLVGVIACQGSDVYSQTSKAYPKGIIERLSPELDAIVSKDAMVEVIADGFTWVEGPVWIESQQMLLVSDVFKNRIYKWTEEEGKQLYLEPSGYTQAKPRAGEFGSNGLAINPKGQLLLCQHGDRRVALLNSSMLNPRPTFNTLAATYKGKKFNSPNDLDVRSNGDIYFTDPPYGLEKSIDDPLKEIPYQGVYKISAAGKVTLLTDTISRPNGIAFFPGEKRLLIANSDPEKPYWYAYDLNDKGELVNGKLFYDGSKAFQKEPRTPDGLKIDKDGNVFAPGPGGVWIFNESGDVLGRIKVNVLTSNCAFANNDKTLFITAEHYLLKVDLR